MEQRLGMIPVSDTLIEGGSPYIHSTGDQILDVCLRVVSVLLLIVTSMHSNRMRTTRLLPVIIIHE